MRNGCRLASRTLIRLMTTNGNCGNAAANGTTAASTTVATDPQTNPNHNILDGRTELVGASNTALLNGGNELPQASCSSDPANAPRPQSGSNESAISQAVDLNNNKIAPPPVGAAKSSSSNDANLATDDPSLKVVISPHRGAVELLKNPEKATIVYTDASVKNGVAGIGVYFGDHHQDNVSQRLPGHRRDNTEAEALAAVAAIEKHIASGRKTPLIIRTDSLAIVAEMQKPASCQNGTYAKLRQLAESSPYGVQFQHVYAHMGEHGNEKADELATKATSRFSTPSPRRSRSKPPSHKMMRRTRSVFVGGRKNKKAKAPAATAPVQQSGTISVAPPQTVLQRDRKQKKQLQPAAESIKTESKSSESSTSGTESSSLEVDKTQRSPVAEPPSPFRSRFSSNLRTPVRHAPKPTAVEGRPLTWAPKKKASLQNSTCKTKTKAQLKMENAQRQFKDEQEVMHLINFMEDVKRKKGKQEQIQEEINNFQLKQQMNSYKSKQKRQSKKAQSRNGQKRSGRRN